MKQQRRQLLLLAPQVFPRIRAGASLKLAVGEEAVCVGRVFPRIRAGASLKQQGRRRRQVLQPGFSPAFVRGPH